MLTSIRTFLVCLTATICAPVFAAQVIVPAPPELSAKAYLLIDADTGKVIVEHNADEVMEPASLTKMMTSYIVSEEIESGRLTEDALVLVSDDAWRRGGSASGSSTMFLDPRSEVRVIDMLRGVIIQSGNDASIALAQHIAGDESAFADVMNQQAQLLGMTSSNFENATGWPAEGHVTTARDLSILAAALVNDHPEHYSLYSEKYFKYNGINQPNRNRLLFRDDSVDGMKTGHTESAGYCLVASAKQDDMRLISVVLGTKSDAARTQDSQKLLSYGFRYYKTYTLYKEGESISDAKVWKGLAETVALTVNDDIEVTIPRGAHKSVKAVTRVDTIIEAPVTPGQILGSLVLTLEDEVLAEYDLVAATKVDEAGFFARTWDSILLMFEDEDEAASE